MIEKEDNGTRRIKWTDILRYAVAVALLLLTGAHVFQQLSLPPVEEKEALFQGEGSQDDPYQINSEEDLALLAETVNAGEVFDGMYFQQTRDLDLSAYENWIPIGTYECGKAFAGIYDGGGHVIRNLTIHGKDIPHKTDKGDYANVGLFGRLAGVVHDLGIESGEITGACIGSIASHSSGSKAMIINCYNKASLEGSRCGGIADNFSGGKIICCWNSGALNGNQTGAVTSYGTGTVFGCAGLEPLVSDEFVGVLHQSEVCEQIDPGAVEANFRQARYEFDLQYIYG